jgi:hypothetical protein
LGFPGPPQTRFTPSFLIFKKKLKFDGGYYTGGTLRFFLEDLGLCPYSRFSYS